MYHAFVFASGSPQSLPLAGFRQSETCSDCIERDDVDLLGRIRSGRQARVKLCDSCLSARVESDREYVSPCPEDEWAL